MKTIKKPKVKCALFSNKDFSHLPDNLDKAVFSVMAADAANKKTEEFSNRVLSLVILLRETEKRRQNGEAGFELYEDLRSLKKVSSDIEGFILSGALS